MVVRTRRRLTAIAAAAAGLQGFAPPAFAHPHVFVSVHSALILGPDRKIAAVRQDWTFDEMYTAFAVTGFGKTADAPSPQDLEALAARNMQDMADYKYFTVLKSAAGQAAFAKPVDYSADLLKTQDDYSLQLHFTLPLTAPMAPGQGLVFRVYDPTYFVSFAFGKQKPISFSGDGGACAASLAEPKPLSPSERASLTESFFTNLSPGADFGIKLAETAVISCHWAAPRPSH